MAQPLTDLLKKDAFFKTTDSQKAWSIKTSYDLCRVFKLPDFSKIFVVQVDASGKGMGPVLHQKDTLLLFIVKNYALYYKTPLLTSENCSQLLPQFRMAPLLLGNKFIVETCHGSFKELMTHVVQTPAQHYYLRKLLGYDYDTI